MVSLIKGKLKNIFGLVFTANWIIESSQP